MTRLPARNPGRVAEAIVLLDSPIGIPVEKEKIMKRLTAVLLSLIFVVAIGATAFAAFDTSRIDQYFETETQKRIDSMLELVLGKEKAEELVETSRTSSYDFTQVEAYVNQHVAQQSSEMFRLIEAAEQKD